MAQSGYTPILIYASGTATNVPLAANLTSSASGAELALNYADGKLYYKNSSGVVTLLAGSGGGGPAAGSNTQIQFNSSGVFGASANLTWSGTVLATTGLTATGAILHNTTTNNQSYTTTGAGTITISSGTTGTIDGMNIGATTAGTGRFSSITNTGLTSGRVVYSTTGGLETDSANLTFDGTNLTLLGGTANGVAYLNGSKVLTTGSTFVFDGTNVGIGTSNPAGFSSSLAIRNDSGTCLSVNSTASAKLNFQNIGTDSFLVAMPTGTGALAFYSSGTTERMRITSAGDVGIGTSSPGSKFTISGGDIQINGGRSTLFGDSTSGYFPYIKNPSSGTSTIAFFNSASVEQMRIDSSGNLGLGVTPSAWGSGQKALQTPAGAIWNFNNSNMTITQNSFSDGTEKYINNGFASKYNQNSGQHVWSTAPSGTAGNTISFTQAMTLDASGNLGIGTISPSSYGKLTTIAAAASTAFYAGSSTQGVYISNSTGTDVVYNSSGSSAGAHVWQTGNTERARIDTSGNLLVGATTASNTPSQGITLMKNTNIGSIGIGHASGTADGNGYLQFAFNGSSIGSVTQSGSGTAVLYNLTSDARLKENVADADDAASLIDALQVRKFDWKAGGEHQRYGFIAQELVTVAPEAVSQPEDPDEMMGVDYSKLVPMLVKEIQSLRKRLADAGIA